VTSDVRTLFARKIRSYGSSALLTLLYPRILAIHDLKEAAGFPAGSQGRLEMPALMRAGYGWMVAEGAYIMSQ
jgi:protein transport protein SEC24